MPLAAPARPLPRDRAPESTLALFADPYHYIGKRCRALGSDAFEARILFQRTICMSGPEAARMFYDKRHMQRAQAAPEAVQATLFGKGAVQSLDGAEHVRRKALFMQTLGDDAVGAIAGAVSGGWHAARAEWPRDRATPLYPAAQDVLARAVCDWAGVPLDPAEARERREDLVALFDSAARGVLPHVRSRLARKRAETWIAGIVEAVRSGRRKAAPERALHAVSTHRDADGRLLASRVAAVELLNLLRPTVAVSVYIVFVAHALIGHPEMRTRLRAGDPAYRRAFVEEVRRFYPFFPSVAARVREAFDWQGLHFPRGRRVLLDLYGTNHDPRVWQEPDRFMPERFVGFSPSPFAFIPQGGARADTHHRCPGETLATRLMEVSLGFFLGLDDFELAARDMRIDETRLPALPADPIVLRPVPSSAGEPS